MRLHTVGVSIDLRKSNCSFVGLAFMAGVPLMQCGFAGLYSRLPRRRDKRVRRMVERSETHRHRHGEQRMANSPHSPPDALMGFASLNPSYRDATSSRLAAASV